MIDLIEFYHPAISDPTANLPTSNALFYNMLNRAGGTNPHNDMQVHVPDQRIGGDVTELEIVGPLAEGNHWQWELASDAMPESVMPAEMTERIPNRELLLSYFQALSEMGVLLAEQ